MRSGCPLCPWHQSGAGGAQEAEGPRASRRGAAGVGGREPLVNARPGAGSKGRRGGVGVGVRGAARCGARGAVAVQNHTVATRGLWRRARGLALRFVMRGSGVRGRGLPVSWEKGGRGLKSTLYVATPGFLAGTATSLCPHAVSVLGWRGPGDPGSCGDSSPVGSGPTCDPRPSATSLEAPSLVTAPPGVRAVKFGGTQFSRNRCPPGGVGSLPG